MIFIIIGLLALAVGLALTLRAIAGLRSHVSERVNSLADLTAGLAQMLKDQAADYAHENLLQHKIGRAYLVEILEHRILPTIGWEKPSKTEVENWMLRTWREEVIDRETTPETSETN